MIIKCENIPVRLKLNLGRIKSKRQQLLETVLAALCNARKNGRFRIVQDGHWRRIKSIIHPGIATTTGLVGLLYVSRFLIKSNLFSINEYIIFILEHDYIVSLRFTIPSFIHLTLLCNIHFLKYIFLLLIYFQLGM